MPKPSLFVSYSSHDRAFAEVLDTALVIDDAYWYSSRVSQRMAKCGDGGEIVGMANTAGELTACTNGAGWAWVSGYRARRSPVSKGVYFQRSEGKEPKFRKLRP